MIEPWALELDLDSLEPSHRADAMRAFSTKVTKQPTKKDRVTVGSLEIAQSQVCTRQQFADYYNDEDETGILLQSSWLPLYTHDLIQQR